VLQEIRAGFGGETVHVLVSRENAAPWAQRCNR
jgi:hypothetical protein